MKKLLTLLLTLLMMFTLVGCNSTKEETPAAQELEQQEVIEKIEEETEIAGGYVDVEDGTLTDELKDIFSKALEGLTGAKYEPVELVATQVVAGTNYKFLANGTKTTNPITKGTYYITIYKDLQGNVKLLDIEVIEEKQEEVKEETKKEIDPEVLKTYKYWVVFFDQDGNELQREAIKWGSTPSYWSGTPYYEDGEHWYRFTGWKDRWGRDVKEFKPITGNTRFYAQYEIGGNVSHSSGGDGGSQPPAPLPDHTQVECLTSVGGASATFIDSLVSVNADMEIVMEAKMKKVVGTRPFGTHQYRTFINRYVGFEAYAYGYTVYAGGNSSQGGNNVGFGTKSTYVYVINSSGSSLTVNGTLIRSVALGDMPGGNLCIFTFNDATASTDNQPLSIYSMKITKSGILERDYIAVKTNKEIDMTKNATDSTTNIPADTLCFYDQQNDMYYLNGGTGEFTSTPIPD